MSRRKYAVHGSRLTQRGGRLVYWTNGQPRTEGPGGQWIAAVSSVSPGVQKEQAQISAGSTTAQHPKKHPTGRSAMFLLVRVISPFCTHRPIYPSQAAEMVPSQQCFSQYFVKLISCKAEKKKRFCDSYWYPHITADYMIA